MKKIIGLPAVVLSFTFLACSDQPAETKKEVIVTPAPPAEKKEVVIVKEPAKEPVKDTATSITIDKKGVKVESKKVKVDVHPN